MTNVVAAILVLGILGYAVFGGADFGAGFWDLVAGGAERGARPRRAIQLAIGPVWEANHVWLIFVLVVLWTSFPETFGSIMLTLFVPLSLAAFGIVLRGSSFAFRKEVSRTSSQRNFGAAFAISSVITPFCLGAVAGAVATGRVPKGGVAGDLWASWLNPTSVLGGVLAVSACAFVAANNLVVEADRFHEPDLSAYFRRRAVGSALVTGVIAVAGIFVLRADAAYLADRLSGVALPIVLVSAACGVGTIVLHRGTTNLRAARAARLLAMGAVVAVVLAWAVGQWPYLLPTSLKIADAAAPRGTLITITVVFAIAALTILPALGWLYWLDQHDFLEAESEAESKSESGAAPEVAPTAKPEPSR